MITGLEKSMVTQKDPTESEKGKISWEAWNK